MAKLSVGDLIFFWVILSKIGGFETGFGGGFAFCGVIRYFYGGGEVIGIVRVDN